MCHNLIVRPKVRESVAGDGSAGISTQFFRIGCDSPNLGLYWNGMVDDLRLYDHALSATEIADATKGIGSAHGQAVLPSPVAARAGRIYIDDIGFGRAAQ